VKDLSKEAFINEAKTIVPSITVDDTEPSFAGVMAQVSSHGSNVTIAVFYDVQYKSILGC
jgi:hypothetical protein